ncbi:hypothetical protein RchiOBHm_Chr2g0138821 [Rosa chinensis]|uniref:Uncharacterized protein n=1 Tax=Rosa chinensis TaxID=74649 RepID=A0A2P6RX05_ROSCH|nr:hypothetical protein RchiOBHm_Chr2g0138821 [Rosa chinensis]
MFWRLMIYLCIVNDSFHFTFGRFTYVGYCYNFFNICTPILEKLHLMCRYKFDFNFIYCLELSSLTSTSYLCVCQIIFMKCQLCGSY